MTTQTYDRADQLAAEPLRAAGPTPGFFRGTVTSITDIWGQRELLGLLVRREIKARYKDSVLGFFWTLIRPLTLLFVYWVAIGKFLQASKTIDDFPVFVFTGLTAWQLFSEIVSSGTGSIVGNSGLIKKVYLPREVFPLSVVGSAAFNFVFQLVILVGATVLAGKVPLGARWFYFVAALAVLVVFATALALVLSALNVYLRDVAYLVEIALMVVFWGSPIVYSWHLVEAAIGGTWLEQVYLANPMTLVIMGFQKTFWVAGDSTMVYPDHLATRLGIAFVISVFLLWFCQRVFARLQANFAQEL